MSTEKNLTPMAFKFDVASQEIRSLLIKNEPWFVAKDICDILELTNSRKAIATLDVDEKADVTISYTSSNGVTQNRKVKAISESGLYYLIFKSTKPEAKSFRKWVTSEVLPTIRKKGIYAMNHNRYTDDFIDARDIPYNQQEVNGHLVRVIEIDEELWLSINDVNTAMGARTEANQTAKNLNRKRTLARKIWLYGNTHPAWFTNQHGVSLMLSASRTLRNVKKNQLKLSL